MPSLHSAGGWTRISCILGKHFLSCIPNHGPGSGPDVSSPRLLCFGHTLSNNFWFFFLSLQVSGTVYLTCTLKGFPIGLFKIVFLQNVRGLLHCLKLLSFRIPMGHSASWSFSVARFCFTEGFESLICILTPRTSTLHSERYIWMLTRVHAHAHTHTTQNLHTYIKLRDWTGSQYETLRSLELTM